MKMEIRDPAAPNDGQLTTQSAFSTDTYSLKNETFLFGYKDSGNTIHLGFRTQARVVGYGSGYLDGMFAIMPKYGLSAIDSSIALYTPIKLLGDDKPIEQVFPSGTGGNIVDLALNPVRTEHPYLIDGNNGVWLFDALTGRSRQLATLDHPHRLALGGRDQKLYVVLDRQLVCLEGDGSVRKRAPLSVPLDAIAFDGSRGLLM